MKTGAELLRLENADQSPAPLSLPAGEALRLLLADSRSPETRRAYEADLRDFFRWKVAAEPTPAHVAALCASNTGELALTLNGYKAHLRERRLGESTINRRLAAVRSLLSMARRIGATCPDPAGLVSSEKVTPYRDTRGPSVDAVRLLLLAPNRETLKGKRDAALLFLLVENALRRAEVVSCDVADFDAGEGRLSILGKGRGSQKENVTLSPVVMAAIVEYLTARGNPLGDEPLFRNVDRARKGDGRLTGRALAYIVDAYGRAALGKPLHPHQLRHMAITAVLDATGGDVRTAQRLSRHKDLRTLAIYDDNREDLQGRATLILSGLLH